MSHSVTIIDSLDDPRVSPYRNLKDRELAREGGLFIAEGELVVKRLFESDYLTESVFLSDRRFEEIAPLTPHGASIYVARTEVMHGVMGFKFHSGVIACGRRKPPPALEEIVGRESGRLTLAICPELANAENLGVMIRICSAFGVDAMLLGERSCDPFWRQSVRVSMGNVFRLPILQSRDLLSDLAGLRGTWGFELAATVLDEDAEPLSGVGRPDRLGVLFGNEAQGLGREIVRACDRRVTIPMSLGTDSLNVAVAAGIILHHFCRMT